jgi:O-glycosyl hydrolase
MTPGKAYRFEETLHEAGDTMTLAVSVTAEADIETEGVYFWLDVPIKLFAGGDCSFSSGEMPRNVVLPLEKPARRHFARGTAGRLVMAAPKDQARLELTLDRPLPVTVQDTREWGGDTYSAFFQLAPPLKAGETAAAKITMLLVGTSDTTPAHLTLDADRVRHRFDGFGGNYCFNIESPVTQYTLDNLNVAWARTEMSLALWEPENDNESPDAVNWEAYQRRDTPDSRLRHEWLLMKQIQDKGIPYVLSAWRMPQWITEPDRRGSESRTRRLRPEMWPEMREAIGSYLLYAHQHYGVEPDLFSFNEANIGVDLLLSPEEHHQMIKCLGAHLKKLGLKTKMLLGDTGSARGTHTYCLPAANDPEAMQYVGAIAFHSWGGASPEDYQAWSELADRLKLPLLDTELGVDAGAYRDRSYDSFFYATREVEMYQDVILHARVQGTQQWEFTNDYSIVHETTDAAGKTLIEPTARFHFVKQFCNLTPHASDVLATASDQPKVLVTAFRGKDQVLTLHISNLGAARKATLGGIPADVLSLRAVRTSQTEGFQELAAVQPRNGVLELDLAPQSLLTLTTMR